MGEASHPRQGGTLSLPIWDPGSGQVSALAKMIFAAPLAASTDLISSWALCPLSPGRDILPSLISCRGSLCGWANESKANKIKKKKKEKETEAQMYSSSWDLLVGFSK